LLPEEWEKKKWGSGGAKLTEYFGVAKKREGKRRTK